MIGSRFNGLVVIGKAEPHVRKGRHKFWVCRCDCGAITEVPTRNLRSGHTKSCGCLNRTKVAEAAKVNSATHGATRGYRRTPEYATWAGMIGRCHNRNNPAFHHYGAKGIFVCNEWRASFEAFLAHVGPKPSANHSIDRIDGKRGYEPGNVRWATRVEQSRNRDYIRTLTFRGETKLLIDWCRELGLNHITVRSRIDRQGWSVEETLTKTPSLHNRRKSRRIAPFQGA